jgi:hypothetical protein
MPFRRLCRSKSLRGRTHWPPCSKQAARSLTGQDRLKELAPADGIGNTPTMTATPPPTRYHRWLGWYAPAMRRAALVSSIGLLVVVVLAWFLPWGMAVVAGWDAAALAFLVCIWPIILRADAAHAAQLATREDETRGTAALLLVAASLASLLAPAWPSTSPAARVARCGCCSSVSRC